MPANHPFNLLNLRSHVPASLASQAIVLHRTRGAPFTRSSGDALRGGRCGRSQLAFYRKHHPAWLPLLRLHLRARRAPPSPLL